MAVTFEPAIPVLRIFSVEKALEFYRDWLGMAVDWEHRFGPDFPLYMELSRGPLVLHLSEHHGDGTPGTVLFVPLRGIDALLAELEGRPYPYQKPGIVAQDWGRELQLTDPFGNRLRFCEYPADEQAEP